MNNTLFGARKITLNNFKMMHHTWHDSNSSFKKAAEDNLLGYREPSLLNQEDNGDVAIYLKGPFLSSERQAHITHGRYQVLSEILSPILKKEGWKEMDWVNISMALSYEGATQYDGLHVVGSSMKMAFHLTMHQLCGAP